LHLANILCKPVLPSQLYTRWKVIYLLVLVQSLVEVAFTLGVRPKHVPVVAIRRNKTIDFEKEAYQFRLALKHLVVHSGLAHLWIN